VARLEDAGASAIVMHSLFEEEMADYARATDRYLEQLLRINRHVAVLKESIAIPLAVKLCPFTRRCHTWPRNSIASVRTDWCSSNCRKSGSSNRRRDRVLGFSIIAVRHGTCTSTGLEGR
jgi:hypothetical protein